MKIFLVTDAGIGKNGWYHVGDEAVFLSLYQRLNNTFPNAQITLYTRSKKNLNIDVFKTIDSSLFFNKKKYFLYLVFLINFKIFRNFIFKYSQTLKEMFCCVSNNDYIIVTGGGNLNSTFSPYLHNRFLLVYFAKKLNKKILFAPQTIGPVRSFKDKFLVKYILQNVNFIQVRDKISLELANSVNSSSKKQLTLDDAFRIKCDKNFLPIDRFKYNVAISLRDWDSISNLNACDQMLSMLVKLHSDIHFYIIPHIFSNDNLGDIKPASNLLDKNELVYTILDANFFKLAKEKRPEEVILGMMAYMDIIITSRYHGAVFGVCSSIKTICLYENSYYMNKFCGIVDVLGQDITRDIYLLVDSKKRNNTGEINKFISVNNKIPDKLVKRISDILKEDDLIKYLRKGD